MGSQETPATCCQTVVARISRLWASAGGHCGPGQGTIVDVFPKQRHVLVAMGYSTPTNVPVEPRLVEAPPWSRYISVGDNEGGTYNLRVGGWDSGLPRVERSGASSV